MEFLRKRALTIFLVLLIFLNIFLWQRVLAESNSLDLKVYFLDIGQGDATLIRAPNGVEALIDGGPTDNSVLTELGEVMPISDRKIEVVLATHPDADHIGGLTEVLKRYEVSNYIESGNLTKDTKTFSALEEEVSEKVKMGMKDISARRGMQVVLDEEDGVYFDILYPDRDVTHIESNEASIILKLVYGNTCFVMSGDAPRDVEHFVAGLEGENLKCQVLKTGHHGSRTSTSPEWVGFIKPEVAVISVGKNNRYGHPHKETLNALEKFNVDIHRTDEEGRIEIESDGENVFVK